MNYSDWFSASALIALLFAVIQVSVQYGRRAERDAKQDKDINALHKKQRLLQRAFLRSLQPEKRIDAEQIIAEGDE